MADKQTPDDLRRIIARCCSVSEAASEVALRALRTIERESKIRRDRLRELRGRLATLEALVGKARAR